LPALHAQHHALDDARHFCMVHRGLGSLALHAVAHRQARAADAAAAAAVPLSRRQVALEPAARAGFRPSAFCRGDFVRRAGRQGRQAKKLKAIRAIARESLARRATLRATAILEKLAHLRRREQLFAWRRAARNEGVLDIGSSTSVMPH